LATSMSQSRTAEAVQMAVLKKARDINAEGGLQLIQATSSVVPKNPPHLGSQIDTFA
jgi:hypothetical protein